METLFEVLTESDVEHGATRRAHEVMVMAARDVFCQFEVGMVLTGDDAMDDVGLFENSEVSVGRTLRQTRSVLQEFHDGLWIGFAV